MVERQTEQEVFAFPIELIPSQDRGELYEQRFEEALDYLLQTHEILSWSKTAKLSQLDLQGIDYFIRTRDGTVPYQITSTKDKAKKHRKKQRANGRPPVPTSSLLTNTRIKTLNELSQEVMAKVHNYFREESSSNFYYAKLK